MIFSAQQLFSDDQAITDTAISTNVIDLGVRGTPKYAKAALTGDKGKGTKIPILVQVTKAMNTLTSMVITIETGPNADLSGSTVLYSSGTLLKAALVAGFQLPIEVLPNKATGRYLGIRYTVTGTTEDQGTITAGITMGNQTNVTGA